ncbi:phage holin family protein [Kerstersia gyiorum]|uniref:3TM holin n=1 Tax=Kerstersia gyiorum TaxID=206506 RepID=A0A171KSI8_9BURK|nr:phage holin family protein [Kerstersia gyiorum]KKO71855.1 hypothetical protein AAV32_09815 [Kerstersia gyiorum]
MLAGIVIAANVYSLAWLLSYRRGRANFKRCVSLLAYALVLTLGGQVVEVGLNHAIATPADAALAALVAVFIHRARGNVACLIYRREEWVLK